MSGSDEAAADRIARHKASDYAVVFSGGGALGAWELGCLKAVLAFHGKGPSIVTGASAGALNAAGHFIGYHPDELGKFWKELTPDKIYRAKQGAWSAILGIGGRRIGSSLRNVFRKKEDAVGLEASLRDFLEGERSLFDTGPMGEEVMAIIRTADEKKAGDRGVFNNPDCSLVISTTQIADGEPELFYRLRIGIHLPARATDREHTRFAEAWRELQSLENLHQALMGTAALPVLFPAFANRHDGGVLLNQPIAPALLLGAKLVYVFIPAPIKFFLDTHLIDMAQSLLSLWLATSLEAQVRRVGENNLRRRQMIAGMRSQYAESLWEVEDPIRQMEDDKQRLCVVRPEFDLGVGLLEFGKDVERMIADGARRANEALKKFDYDVDATWSGHIRDDIPVA